MRSVDTREGTELISSSNKLWHPPLSPKDQKILNRSQKKGFLKWTGFAHKTLWDWLQLLIIPTMLAVIGIGFSFTQEQASRLSSQRQHDTDIQIALDQQRQEALVTYQKDISDLLLTHQLRSSRESDEVRSVARIRTLSTLQALDSDRKGFLVQFLSEAGLITRFYTENPIISLSGANLKGANLYNTDLRRTDLRGADLRGAIFGIYGLSEAYLMGADLRGANFVIAGLSNAYLNNANLEGTRLGGANLKGANLSEANLRGADLKVADLSEAHLFAANLRGANLVYTDLTGANLSEAILDRVNLTKAKYNIKDIQKKHTLNIRPTQWPQGFDPQAHGAICVDCEKT
jgi:uncharacterized protein YjbI with pentapeptide repeats